MKKVLVIGAGFLQSFVIRKAKELGYYTLAVDANPNAEGFKYADEYGAVNIIDEKACLEFAKKHKVDGVLTAATDYGVLTASYIAQELGLHGINYPAAKRVKNKFQVRECLYAAGADDTAPSCEIKDESDIENAIDSVKLPVMIKPCDGSGSRGAARVDRKEDFAAACKAAMANSLTHRATIEPFIDGEEYGVESFVKDGEIFVLAVMGKKMTKPPYYAELGHRIPSGLEEGLELKVKECVRKAIRALDINFGSVNMDLIITKSGTVHIIDIGARMGGNLIGSHIVPTGTGIDYIENMIKAFVGDASDFSPKRAPKPVATRILALTPGKIEKLPSLEGNANTVIEHHLCVGDEIREYHTNLDGCGYVVCTDESIENAERTAEQTKKCIDAEIVRKK